MWKVTLLDQKVYDLKHGNDSFQIHVKFSKHTLHLSFFLVFGKKGGFFGHFLYLKNGHPFAALHHMIIFQNET